MVSTDYIKKLQERDKKIFTKDFKDSQKHKNKKNKDITPETDYPLISDFTEYSPLHNGHYHCIKKTKNRQLDNPISQSVTFVL